MLRRGCFLLDIDREKKYAKLNISDKISRLYIMKISKKAQYALTAMVHLAKNHAYGQAGKKTVSVREVSNIERVPFEFLSKTFSVLEKAKLVKAKYGANGGYVLAKSPQKITTMDIVVLLDDIKVVDCQFCPKLKNCLTKNVWGKVNTAVARTLASITLADLIK